jgi:hypothetical protein
MKTITIRAKEWFDKANGNSYFSAVVEVEKENEVDVFKIPFQYGYGNHYETEVKAVLTEHNVISCEYGQNLRRYCEKNNIEFNSSIETECKKRELKFN